MNGGVNTPESLFIDSSVGRIAQILQKMNVGISGSFARLLETNNLDTFFNPDENYSCNTKNYITVTIKDSTWLKLYDKRFYKFKENGPEYLLNFDTDKELIGQTLLFRSPITCESYANGTGICRKCYGNLYYTNKDINPGKIAAEILSSIYTQMLLSAKHLLESSVVEMKWCSHMSDIFNVELNMMFLREDINAKKIAIIIDPSTIDSDDSDTDEASLEYNEYVNKFEVMMPTGETVEIYTSDSDNIYITQDLNQLLNSKHATELPDGKISIQGSCLENVPLFSVEIENKELQRTLERSKQIINKSSVTESYTKDGIVTDFINANLDGKIMLQAVHMETIIANQIRDPEDYTAMPNWGIKDVPYKLLGLNSALTNSPSITTTLEFQRIANTLVSPLSTKKRKASVFDLFFMEKPQDFIVNQDFISDKVKESKDEKMINGIEFVEIDDAIENYSFTNNRVRYDSHWYSDFLIKL